MQIGRLTHTYRCVNSLLCVTLLSSKGPVIVVTVQPHTVISFVTPPYNTFTLNCTASVHDTVFVPKTFYWRVLFGGREINVFSNGDTIIIADVNLNALTSNSILRVRETTSGTYHYTCTCVLQFPGVQDNITGFSSANVTVRGREASRYTDSLINQARDEHGYWDIIDHSAHSVILNYS